MYVTCSICGRRYKGKVPMGGDGSVLFPRKHKIKIYNKTNLGFTPVFRKEYCDGSFMEAREYNKSEE